MLSTALLLAASMVVGQGEGAQSTFLPITSSFHLKEDFYHENRKIHQAVDNRFAS